VPLDETTSAVTGPPADDEYATRLPDHASVRGGSELVGDPSRQWPLVPGYEIIGELGRGGMGVVYKAQQKDLKRTVALKMILSGAQAGDQEVTRFRAEAEAVAKLHHPNIVQVYQIGEQEHGPFFSLEYVDGGTLARRLGNTPLANEEAARLVEVLARAVQAAHDAGIVHRDLKPANILLMKDGSPKITDFGLAKQLDAEGLSVSGAIMGTPSYMAPEQAQGQVKNIGPPTDIYGLGAILYECLTGRPPFRAASTLDALRQVVDVPPAPPRLLNRTVAADLEAICLKCLEKSPSQRYASAQDLAQDLGRYLQGEPVRAELNTAARLVRPWLRDSQHKEILARHARTWLWQAGIVFADLLATNILIWCGWGATLHFATVWIVGLVLWLIPSYHFLRESSEWSLVEKQLAESVCLTALASGLFLVIAVLTHAEPVRLLPLWLLLLSVGTGAAAIILRGSFYLLAALCAMSAVVSAVAPTIGPVAFGTAYGLGLFLSAWKHRRAGPNGQ